MSFQKVCDEVRGRVKEKAERRFAHSASLFPGRGAAGRRESCLCHSQPRLGLSPSRARGARSACPLHESPECRSASRPRGNECLRQRRLVVLGDMGVVNLHRYRALDNCSCTSLARTRRAWEFLHPPFFFLRAEKNETPLNFRSGIFRSDS